MVDIDIKKKLDKFNIDIELNTESKRIGILGASGSGKSMTLKMIAGIEKPDKGHICVDSKLLYNSENKINISPQKRKTGYLFQNYALFPKMTVEQNIAAGLKGKNKHNIVTEMIEKFRLTGLEKRYPHTLSGGQQQRCAIARIMAYNPDVILLDEPFSALDIHLRDEMQRELMAMLSDYEGTVIMVSHSRDEIYRMSDELIILDNGTVSVSGKTKDVFKNPLSKVAARLTGCKNIADVNTNNKGIYIPDWDIFLPISDYKIKFVAIRAHEFTLCENDYCFNINEPVVTEDLFEYNISFKPSLKSKGRINWKISKNNFKGMPDKIYLSKNNLLHLYY